MKPVRALALATALAILLGKAPLVVAQCEEYALWPQPPGQFIWSAQDFGTGDEGRIAVVVDSPMYQYILRKRGRS